MLETSSNQEHLPNNLKLPTESLKKHLGNHSTGITRRGTYYLADAESDTDFDDLSFGGNCAVSESKAHSGYSNELSVTHYNSQLVFQST